MNGSERQPCCGATAGAVDFTPLLWCQLFLKCLVKLVGCTDEIKGRRPNSLPSAETTAAVPFPQAQRDATARPRCRGTALGFKRLESQGPVRLESGHAGIHVGIGMGMSGWPSLGQA